MTPHSRVSLATYGYTCLLLTLFGCASERPAPQLPAFERIALLSVGGSRADLHADSTAAKATVGATGGAAGGAGTGALIGLACGPLALFCVPVGMVVGGVTGAAAGGITQGGKGLSGENSRRVNELLQQQQPSLDIHEQLYEAVRLALPADRLADEQSADAIATLRVTLIELRQHSNQRVSFTINAEMYTEWDQRSKKPARQTNRYEYETAREAVEDWLADDGAGFRRGIATCIERVAGWMARDLRGGTESASTSETGLSLPRPGNEILDVLPVGKHAQGDDVAVGGDDPGGVDAHAASRVGAGR